MRRGLCLLAAALLASCSPSGDESTAVETRLDYPDARPVEQVDVYHGVEVADPYRWLEDLSSLETEAFVSAQDSLTRAYLSSKPEREILRRRLVALNDYDVYRLPQRAGDRYFFIHRQGLEDQPILHMSRSLSGPSEILVDPNRLSADGTVSLHYFEPSTDGRRVLYTLSTAGSDWREVRVVDVESRRELDDRIRGIHTFSSLAWSHDGDGIYYGRPPTPASVGGPDLALDHSTVFFHRIGDDQAQDRIVYERPDEPAWWLGAIPKVRSGAGAGGI